MEAVGATLRHCSVPLRASAARPSRAPGTAAPALAPQTALGAWRPCAPLLPLRQAAPLQAAARRVPPVRAAGSDQEPAPSKQQQPAAAGASSGPDGTSLASSVGLFLLWAGLAVYAFLVAPNQTPLRDSYFLEKLVGLGVDDGVPINIVVQQLFLIMGVWPLVYTALLVPSGKSDNGVPAWPFLTLSYAFGAFGLLPFMALWQPPKQPPKVPADKEDLEGVGNLMQKGMESPIVPVLCLVGSIACIGQAALAGSAQWDAYLKLLEESRFINVMTVDFLTLTTLAPFWMANDAALRKWDKQESLLPILSVLPVFGPVIYLCLRPRAQLS